MTALEDGTDLRVRAVDVSPRIVQPGQNLGLQFEVVNLGNREAPASQAGIRTNDGPDIMGSALLGQIDVPIIPPRSTVLVQGSVAIPEMAENANLVVLVRADETEMIAELNDDNNVGRAALRIDAEQACPADALEPNSSPHEMGAGLSVLADVVPGMYADLVACLGDDDWYRIRLDAGQRLRATIEYPQAEGDLELALYPLEAANPSSAKDFWGVTRLSGHVLKSQARTISESILGMGQLSVQTPMA